MLKLQQLSISLNVKKFINENNVLLAFDYIAGEAQLGLGECSFIKKYNSEFVYIILS